MHSLCAYPLHLSPRVLFSSSSSFYECPMCYVIPCVFSVVCIVLSSLLSFPTTRSCTVVRPSLVAREARAWSCPSYAHAPPPARRTRINQIFTPPQPPRRRVGDSDPQRPSTGCVWRPILHFTYNVQLGEWGFVRWIGVNPGWFSREETRLWRCFPHSTNKRMCIERTIKKVVVVHPQGTSCVINNRMPNALHFFFTFYALRRLLPATPSTQCL